MERNAFPPEGLSEHDPETQNPETVIRVWIRTLASREETYHAARQRVLALFEDEYFHWLMQRTAGNRSKAARMAGITRRTVYRLAAHHPNGQPDPLRAEPPRPVAGDFDARLRDATLVARGPIR